MENNPMQSKPGGGRPSIRQLDMSGKSGANFHYSEMLSIARPRNTRARRLSLRPKRLTHN
jgi:hypothetical protein